MIKQTLSALALSLATFVAQADGLKALEIFLRDVAGGQATFTQVVTSPPRAGETAGRSKTSQGTFEFLRPNRFRFEYQKPFPQSIVADGKTLWLFDADLNQVTARAQQAVLGSTPAALIAAGTDLKALGEVFELKSGEAANGLEWVEAKPRQQDGQLQTVRVGLRRGELAQLEIADSLGQRSVLTFTQWQAAGTVAPTRFRFTPPAGADVIRQ
jgi:outer membrane lipoprotein carrier protein